MILIFDATPLTTPPITNSQLNDNLSPHKAMIVYKTVKVRCQYASVWTSLAQAATRARARAMAMVPGASLQAYYSEHTPI